jgi:hypothetical protein
MLPSATEQHVEQQLLVGPPGPDGWPVKVIRTGTFDQMAERQPSVPQFPTDRFTIHRVHVPPAHDCDGVLAAVLVVSLTIADWAQMITGSDTAPILMLFVCAAWRWYYPVCHNV